MDPAQTELATGLRALTLRLATVDPHVDSPRNLLSGVTQNKGRENVLHRPVLTMLTLPSTPSTAARGLAAAVAIVMIASVAQASTCADGAAETALQLLGPQGAAAAVTVQAGAGRVG